MRKPSDWIALAALALTVGAGVLYLGDKLGRVEARLASLEGSVAQVVRDVDTIAPRPSLRQVYPGATVAHP